MEVPKVRVCRRAATHTPQHEIVQVVEATCIICFKDYEVGDDIVFATQSGDCAGEGGGASEATTSSSPISSMTTSCPHVFHKDCMLRWIATGKQRCPICRRYFVPAIPFDEMRHLVDTAPRDDEEGQPQSSQSSSSQRNLESEPSSSFVLPISSDSNV